MENQENCRISGVERCLVENLIREAEQALMLKNWADMIDIYDKFCFLI